MFNRLPVFAFGTLSIASIICTALVVQMAIEAAQHPVGDLMPAMVEVTFASLVFLWPAGWIHNNFKKGNHMIEALEIASQMILEKDLKSRAKSLRSTASSLRSEIEFADNRKLSDREVASLNAAAEIVSKLASRYAEAAKLQARTLDAQQARKAAAMREIEGTFGKLDGADLKTLVWAVDGESGIRRMVREGRVDLPDLLDTIAWRASNRARDGVEAVENARRTWRKFQDERERYKIEAGESERLERKDEGVVK